MFRACLHGPNQFRGPIGPAIGVLVSVTAQPAVAGHIQAVALPEHTLGAVFGSGCELGGPVGPTIVIVIATRTSITVKPACLRRTGVQSQRAIHIQPARRTKQNQEDPAIPQAERAGMWQ